MSSLAVPLNGWRFPTVLKVVGYPGLEPRTPWSQTRCAAHCASIRKEGADLLFSLRESCDLRAGDAPAISPNDSTYPALPAACQPEKNKTPPQLAFSGAVATMGFYESANSP